MNPIDAVAPTALAALMQVLGALPAPVLRRAAGRYARPVDGSELAPEVALVLRLMELAGGPSFETFPPPEARARIKREARLFAGAPIRHVDVEDVAMPGPAGEVPGRLYRGAVRSLPDPTPLVIWYHGGGWVVCDLETHDPLCRFVAAETGIPVLSVDYRLAPEHPFPAAVEDSVAAFRWAGREASSLGVDPVRICVAGDSAGGNLAAVVAQECVGDEIRPALQALVYPVTDISTKHRSYELFADGYFLTAAQMDWYRDNYVGDASGADPRCSPLLAEDLSGLPPAYVTTAGFDVLRDEGEAYAARLETAGVQTTLRRHPGLIHGWVNAFGLGHTPRRAAAELLTAIGSGLA